MVHPFSHFERASLLTSYRSDLLYSIRTRALPRLPFQQISPSTPILNFLPAEHPYRSFAPNSPLLFLTTKQSFEIFAILQQLHDLASILNAFPNGMGQELPVELQYPDRVYTVEHQVISSLHSQTVSSSTTEQLSPSDTVVNILLHACLLYIYTNLRQTPVGGAMRRSIAARLQETISLAADINGLMQTYAHEILWVCILGFGTNVERDSWTDLLMTVVKRQGHKSCEDIGISLGCMPVLERVFKEKTERAWNDALLVVVKNGKSPYARV
jgi:hypothetical protein